MYCFSFLIHLFVTRQSPEGLWGVVNNAGISTFGEVEWVPHATYRRMLDVNVLGVVAANKTFLPLVRKARGQ